MALLDDLAPGMLLKGIRPQATVTIVAVTRHGADSAEIIYKDAAGALGSQLVYRADTEQLEIAPATLPWSFTADGAAFRLVSEAHRIHPQIRRRAGYVHVNDLARLQLDDEKGEKRTKKEIGHLQEITGPHLCHMIVQERPPGLSTGAKWREPPAYTSG